MRYVGATRWFIATPFVLEGIIIGVVSSTVAYFIEMKIYEYITQMMAGSNIGLITLIPFSDINTYIFFGFLAIGIFTGVVGSLISLRKRVEA